MAFTALDVDAESEILTVPQADSVAMAEAQMLPSFLYLPQGATAAQLQGQKAAEGLWVVGRLARTRAAECPGRVVHSAKSWLCHHAADRSLPFLPWGSSDIASERKVSPVRASALILRCLRDAWNERFAGAGADFAFDSQVITVAVPASFDAMARRLTLAAAEEAGFPKSVRLLEEPQAAFYCWLERHARARSPLESSRNGSGPRHVLVVDVGGGTSDFTLLDFRPDHANRGAEIRSIAASNHILLGGDNMDLAIAHCLEPQLVDEREGLSDGQWRYLVALCRDVKEKALSGDGPAHEVFAVSVPGRDPNLSTELRTGHLTRAEIEALLLDAFFPECDADSGPVTTKGALGEWGLPYAPDPAVTRHLAAFLRNRPAVGALLFNGGSLRPWPFRQRICRLIGKWQECSPPIELENSEPDLAVARGAAHFGKFSHDLFLEAHRTPSSRVDDSDDSDSEVMSATSAEVERGIDQRVRERAYSIWEVEGQPEGRQLDHWAQAELDVSTM